MEKKTETEETVTPRSLETVRLLIRPFQEEDADAFFACCQNPNLGNNAGWAPHKTIEESREILQNVFIGQENIWAMILKDAQQLIGSIGIVPDPKRENPQVRMLPKLPESRHSLAGQAGIYSEDSNTNGRIYSRCKSVPPDAAHLHR